MARKAEFIFVGDAKSVINAAQKAQKATHKLATETEKDHKRMSGSFAGMAKHAAGMAAGFAGAYASIAGAKNAVETTEGLAHATLSLHKNLGLTVEQSSRWAAVARSRDIDSKALNQSFGTLAKNALAAKGGAQGNIDTFHRLGISMKDLKGQGFDQTIKAVSDGLAKMAPGGDRTATTMKLLGKGWQTITPLMRGGSKAMDEQLKLADKYGVTFKGKTVKSLEDMIAAQRESKFATMGLQVAFGTQLAPALTKAISATTQFVAGIRSGTGAGGAFAAKVRGAVQPVRDLVKGFRDGKTWAVALVGGLAGLAAGVAVIRTIVAVTRAWAAAQVALNVVMTANPIGLVVVAIAALGAGLVIAYKKSATFRRIVNGAFNAVRTVAENVFPLIGKLARNGLLGPLPLIIARWGQLKKLPGQVAGFFSRLPGRMMRIGEQVVSGLAQGIRSKIGDAVGSIKDLVTSLPKKAMGFLGINSPSKVFHAIGLGVGEGLRDGLAASKSMVRAGMNAGVLFPMEAALRDLEAQKERLQASFDAWDRKRERQGLMAAIGAAARGSVTSSSGGGVGAASGGPGLSWAQRMVGHFKESTGSNTGPELDRLQKDFGTRAAAWCAEFATTALIKAGAPKELKSASVAQLRGWAEAGTHGLQRGVKSTGRAGDLMAFGNNHIGVVEKIVNGVVHTIEGNTSAGKVARRTHAMGSGDFFRPTMSTSAAGGTIRTTTSGKMSATSFAEALLKALGIKATAKNLKGIVGWEKAEGGHWGNDAKFNPLNTTQNASGAKSINSVGVKAYGSWTQGLEQTVKTLKNGKYGKILAALRSGDPAAIADAIGSSPWGTNAGLARSAIAGAKVGKRGGGLAGVSGSVKGGDGGSVADAVKALHDFDMAANRSKKLSKIDVQVRGLERVKAFKAAIEDLRASIADKLNEAVDRFRSNWESTTGKAIDAANAGILKSFDAMTDGILKDFDKVTDAMIEASPAATTLARMRGEDKAKARAKEDRDLEKDLKDAQFLVDHSAGKVHADALVALQDVKDRIEEVKRGRLEEILSAEADAEADAIRESRARERADAEDRRATERMDLEQSMSDQRQALMDADVAYFQVTESAKLDMLTASLEAQKVSYREYVRQVNGLLAGIGVAGFDPNADQEAIVNAGMGASPASSTKSPGKAGKWNWSDGKGFVHTEPRWDWGDGKGFVHTRARAVGGPIGPGTIYRVGELGPEDIYVDRSGGTRVRQASESGRGGSGGGNIIMSGPVTIGSNRAARVMANQLAHRLRFG